MPFPLTQNSRQPTHLCLGKPILCTVSMIQNVWKWDIVHMTYKDKKVHTRREKIFDWIDGLAQAKIRQLKPTPFGDRLYIKVFFPKSDTTASKLGHYQFNSYYCRIVLALEKVWTSNKNSKWRVLCAQQPLSHLLYRKFKRKKSATEVLTEDGFIITHILQIIKLWLIMITIIKIQ